METCLLIFWWMGRPVEPNVYKCFETKETAKQWSALVRYGDPYNDWLTAYFTRAELKRFGARVVEAPES